MNGLIEDNGNFCGQALTTAQWAILLLSELKWIDPFVPHHVTGTGLWDDDKLEESPHRYGQAAV
ncbi:MAG: hypothetical protein KDC43_27420 [Saprospiraceae bacterium]|nr:hypothetical protein [Saprospiraceae bacterium]